MSMFVGEQHTTFGGTSMKGQPACADMNE